MIEPGYGLLGDIAAKDIENTRRSFEEAGFWLDDLIEAGRAIRGELLREMYGIDPGESEE